MLRPTDRKITFDSISGFWRLTLQSQRRVYLFRSSTLQLSQILDDHGNSLNLTYGGASLTQVSDGLGRSLTFLYGSGGLLSSVSDGTRAVNFSYTGGTLTGVTDAAGHAWTYAYAGSGGASFVALLGQVSEPLGNTPLTQTFDANGRVLTQTDALGHVASYAWGAAAGNTFADPLGNTWTFQHDAERPAALARRALFRLMGRTPTTRTGV